MKNLFVPYELALKLKEKWFDEPCLRETIIPAPLYQQVIDWFREKHNIHLWVQPFMCYDDVGGLFLADESYSYYIFKDAELVVDAVDFVEYYEALNEAITKSLELI